MNRSVKTEKDIALLREGGKRLARVVLEVSKKVRPGVSTHELNALAEKLIREGGDEPSFLGYTPRGAKRPFPAALCVSINEEVVHGIPNENALTVAEGDIVGLDCGITHHGLITDHAVSVIAGVADQRAVKLLKATQQALLAGIDAARSGNTIGDISAAIEAVGREAGYGIVYELGGHGVGYAVHEEPYVPNVGERGSGETLVPGMVLAIEPMFTEGTSHAKGTRTSSSRWRSSLVKVQLMPDGYTFVTKDNSRSAHFEHTILITDSSPEILTLP